MRAPTAPTERPARRPRRWPFVVVGVLVLLALGASYGVTYLLSPTGAPRVTVEVRPGTTPAALARELERRGLVRSADAFRLVLRYTGTDTSLREGLYDLSGAQNALELASALRRAGRPRVVRVTIPEGLRLNDVVARLQRAGLGERAELEAAFRDVARLPWTLGARDLEGFLFPATYPFRPEVSPREVAADLTDRFRQEVTGSRLQALERLSLTVYQWVTLASLVQAEAGAATEMSTIAGVFLNRLERGMPLQSDPTVAYGLGKRLPELDRGAGDFERDTPYNTYTRTGLPSGPINNPGEAALTAVLNPRRAREDGRPWLYFLHGLRGEFRPNVDYGSHLRDLERYR